MKMSWFFILAIATVTVFRTSDGYYFKSLIEAAQHEQDVLAVKEARERVLERADRLGLVDSLLLNEAADVMYDLARRDAEKRRPLGWEKPE